MRGQYLKELGYNGASLHDAYETVSSIPTSTSDSLHPDPELELEVELDLSISTPTPTPTWLDPDPRPLPRSAILLPASRILLDVVSLTRIVSFRLQCRPDWLDDVRTPLASPQTVSPQPASVDDDWPPVSPLSRRMRKLEFRLHDLYWNIDWDFEDWFFQESGLWSCLSKVPIDAAWHLMELARGLAGFAQGLAKIFVGFAQGFAKVFAALFLGLSALEDLLEATWVFLGLVRPNEDLVYYLWQRVLLWQWQWELDVVDDDLPTAMPGAYPGFEVERPTPKTKIDVNKETEIDLNKETEIDRKTEIDAEIDTNKEAEQLDANRNRVSHLIATIEKGKFKPAALPRLEEELHRELSLVYPDGQTPPVPTLRRGQEGGNVCRLL
jgi:hypothetical protein